MEKHPNWKAIETAMLMHDDLCSCDLCLAYSRCRFCDGAVETEDGKCAHCGAPAALAWPWSLAEESS